jgi:hypothetical protein
MYFTQNLKKNGINEAEGVSRATSIRDCEAILKRPQCSEFNIDKPVVIEFAWKSLGPDKGKQSILIHCILR